MADDCYDPGFCLRWGVKYLYTAAGIAGLAMMVRLGPIDAGRTLYNQATGDMRVLKTQLAEYCVEGITKKQGVDKEKAADILTHELGLRVRESEQDVSIEVLWDAAEKYAPSDVERWVWTDIGNEHLTIKAKHLEESLSNYFTEKSINSDKK